jgi:hypothetical protein
MTSEPKHRYLIAGANLDNAGSRSKQLWVSLVATGPFDSDEIWSMRGGEEVLIVPAKATIPHPTTTVTAKVTCVLVDDDGFEITVEEPTPEDRYHAKSWRFTVADASNYPVGSTIELEVPA